MSNFLSFLLCLLTFIVVITFSVIGFKYSDEQNAVRSVFEQVSREAAAIGYLDPVVAAYYANVLKQKGFDQTTPYFFVSHTNPLIRAVRPRYGDVQTANNFIDVEIRVKPSFTTQLIDLFKTGQADLIFRNKKVSQYVPEEG